MEPGRSGPGRYPTATCRWWFRPQAA